jgi:hypothetical protein
MVAEEVGGVEPGELNPRPTDYEAVETRRRPSASIPLYLSREQLTPRLFERKRPEGHSMTWDQVGLTLMAESHRE